MSSTGSIRANRTRVELNKTETELLLVCISHIKKNENQFISCVRNQKKLLLLLLMTMQNWRHAKFALECKRKYEIKNCLHMQMSTWSVCRVYSHHCHTITQYSESET